MPPDDGEITRVLRDVSDRSPGALDQLIDLVAGDLRSRAEARLSHSPPWRTLSATALVHETFLRLFGREAAPNWNDRGHFFMAATRAMHDILVERARAATRKKRGGEWKRVPLDSVDPVIAQASHFLELHEAITLLEESRPRAAQVVHLRYFAGLSEDEIAQMLDVSPQTVRRDWSLARGWIRARLTDEPEGS